MMKDGTLAVYTIAISPKKNCNHPFQKFLCQNKQLSTSNIFDAFGRITNPKRYNDVFKLVDLSIKFMVKVQPSNGLHYDTFLQKHIGARFFGGELIRYTCKFIFQESP